MNAKFELRDGHEKSRNSHGKVMEKKSVGTLKAYITVSNKSQGRTRYLINCKKSDMISTELALSFRSKTREDLNMNRWENAHHWSEIPVHSQPDNYNAL